ncbi:uncharacterized protein LOC119601885 [Lucilia sericata]|uniref:uncharacterized protein LOC119601885 n=1 Tax=Lucilia sericata TaxID=13632 RepID=UPI0018A8557A|nr:uncharacterized protein LOC119601885 [Lucilia sericata]
MKCINCNAKDHVSTDARRCASWRREKDIKEIMAIANLSRKEVVQNYSLNSNYYEILSDAIKNFRSGVKAAKRKSFTNKIRELNQTSNSKELYRFVKACKSSGSETQLSRWNNDLNYPFLVHIRDQVSDNSFSSQISTPPPTLDDPFSLEEFLNTLKAKNKKLSAGTDGVTYMIIRRLRTESSSALLMAMNVQWTQCKLRESLRSIRIVPILKRNKDPSLVTGYRPIALISVMSN